MAARSTLFRTCPDRNFKDSRRCSGARFDLDRVPSRSTVRGRFGPLHRLGLTGAVGGLNPQGVGAGSCRPCNRPLPPCVRSERFSKRRLGPRPIVDLYLDLGDPLVRRPCHPGDRDLPVRDDFRAPARRIDPGLGLDRAVLGPAPGNPVAVEILQGGEFDLLQPLGCRDVSVEARTTRRAGNPWSTGSGSPFIPTATNAVRPS